MTNPFDKILNTIINSGPVGPNPAAVAAYHAAPSEFAEPTAVIADLHTALDSIKRLRGHLVATSTPEELAEADAQIADLEATIAEAGLSAPDIVPTPDPGGMIAAYHAAIDELATLRADNDARGQVIEQLRDDLASLLATVARADRRDESLAAELDTVRSERDAAREELAAYRDTNADLCRELDDARMKLDSARRDRDRYFAAYRRVRAALEGALGDP